MKTKEPPSTERYARWSERSANQLMISLRLDSIDGTGVGGSGTIFEYEYVVHFN